MWNMQQHEQEKSISLSSLNTSNKSSAFEMPDMPVAMYQIDCDGFVLAWDPIATRLFGWSEADVVGRRLPIVPDHNELDKLWQTLVEQGEIHAGLMTCQRKNGETFRTITWVYPHFDNNGNTVAATVFATDDFEHTQLHQTLKYAQSTIDHVVASADICIFAHDIKNNRAAFGSHGGYKIYGYTTEEFLSDPLLWRKVIHPDDLAYVDSVSLLQRPPIKTTYRIIRKDGQIRWIENSIYPQLDSRGAPTYIEGISMDITERKEHQTALHAMAYTDVLTSLPNRYQFDEDINLAITKYSKPFGLLYIDFDGFKYVNDTFGHQFGDAVLRQISNMLKECLTKSAKIYRMGGNEFTAILTDIVGEQDLNQFADVVLQKFQSRLWIQNQELAIHPSIGSAIYPHHGNHSDELIRNADSAMYAAKENGGQRHFVYSSNLFSSHKNNLQLHQALIQALRNQEFEIYYQPKLLTTTSELSGVEALIRWNAPGAGIVSPGAFIPFAEQSGLIWEIGSWVLETACLQNKAWQSQGLSPIRMSVNVSMLQLEHPHFLQTVQQILQTSGLDPKWLELEVTESVLVKNLDKIVGVIDELTALGIHVSVDDFGVGYSSLQYLAHMNVGTIKLDRSFIQKLEWGSTVERVVSGIVQLAHAIQMRVVAEGVERDEQLTILKESHCDEVQGFLVLQPQPREQFEKYYRNSSAKV